MNDEFKIIQRERRIQETHLKNTYISYMGKEISDFHISLNDTNIIKGLAICAMLLHHLFYETAQYGSLVQEIGIACKVCSSMFLFISGYGLTVQYTKSGNINQWPAKIKFTVQFLCKRLIKFYFNYWIVFFILVIAGTNIFGRSLSVVYGPESISYCFIKDFFGLQGLSSYISTWWLNRIFICLYLLFPILFWFMKRKSIAIGVLLLLLLWPREWIVRNFFYVLELWDSSLVVYTLIFVIGIFLAQHEAAFNKVLTRINPLWTFAFLFSLTTCLFYIRYLVKDSFVDAITLDAFIALSASIAVVLFFKATNYKSRVLSFLGKHSMNMYLAHTFILMFIFPNSLFKQNPLIIFLFLLAESLFFSILIELLKNKLGFYKLLGRIVENIFAHNCERNN